jgi:hypothetical protein
MDKHTVNEEQEDSFLGLIVWVSEVGLGGPVFSVHVVTIVISLACRSIIGFSGNAEELFGY